MKKLLSLILLMCMLLTVVVLPSCTQTNTEDPTGSDTSGNEDTGNTPQFSTPEEIADACVNQTLATFFGIKGEAFDFSKGVKANLLFDMEKQANFKFEADIISAENLYGFDMKTFRLRDHKFEGFRIFASDSTIVAGFDSFLTKNYGMKFSAAEDQITAVVAKLMPGVSQGSIRTEVRRYLAQIEEAFGSTSAGAPKITPEIVEELISVVTSNINKELNVTDEGISLKITVTLKDVLNILSESIRVLKGDEAWREYLQGIDNMLRETALAEMPIPTNISVFDYLINEFELALSDEGISVDTFAVVIDSVIGNNALIKSATVSLIMENAQMLSVVFAADYSEAAKFTLTLKAHANEYTGLTKDQDILEVTCEKTAKTETSSGFALKIAHKDNDQYVTDETVTAVEVVYSKDTATNEYELNFNLGYGKTAKIKPMYTLRGKNYETKSEAFFSIEELISEETGVAMYVDISIKLTQPTEAEMKLPEYSNVSNIPNKELEKLVDFISQFLPSDAPIV